MATREAEELVLAGFGLERIPIGKPVARACGAVSELVGYAERLGVVNAFIQEGGTQKESFIPDFDL